MQTITQAVANLTDAICAAFMKALPKQPWAPIFNDDGSVNTTFCNCFVESVARAMGYTKFWHADRNEPMTADEMFEAMTLSDEWMIEVSGAMAQIHANNGALVIAAILNPQGHGHVCIVRPGNTVTSGHWGKQAPRVANVGKDVFIDKDAAYAFVPEPSYFTLKSTIQ